MKILWARGESTVNDIAAALPKKNALAYNSVLTTIRILEQKGYVQHRKEGRAFSICLWSQRQRPASQRCAWC